MTDTPSIVVVFFGEEKTLRVKYEGVEEILKGMERLFISEVTMIIKLIPHGGEGNSLRV